MEPLAAHGRPITRIVARADSNRSAAARTSTYAPPKYADCAQPRTDPYVQSIDPHVETAEGVLRALLLGIEIAPLERDVLAPSIVIWSPEVFAAGWSNAMAVLRHGTAERDSLSELTVSVISSESAPPRVFLEWRLSGRFTEPCFVDDDVLVEPTGRHIETAGLLVGTFDGDLLSAVHCYYDGLAVLEQLIADR